MTANLWYTVYSGCQNGEEDMEQFETNHLKLFILLDRAEAMLRSVLWKQWVKLGIFSVCCISSNLLEFILSRRVGRQLISKKYTMPDYNTTGYNMNFLIVLFVKNELLKNRTLLIIIAIQIYLFLD